MNIKLVCFDLYGTLAISENRPSDKQFSDFLVNNGVKVYPQSLAAAWHYVSFIDYPRHGYGDLKLFLKQVLRRLDIRIEDELLAELTRMAKKEKWKIFPDAQNAVRMAKDAGLKTAIITSIPRFRYRRALQSIWGMIDLPVDGYTFRCEKSDPAIYVKTLEALDVKPEQAVMIGDDVDLDVLMPKNLGMKTIFLDRTGTNADRNHGVNAADFTAKNLVEAVDLIKTIR